MQVGVSRATTFGLRYRHVVDAKSVLLIAVDIFGAGVACLLHSFEKDAIQRIAQRGSRGLQGTVVTAINIAATSEGLGSFEVLLATGLTVGTATAVITGSRDVKAETPKRGGLVRMAGSQHGPDDTLDPLLWKETLGYTRGRVHYNGLVQFNDDLTVRPELATSWEANANATEFTFELERGVTFHDGKEFTANDVVYTMQQHLVKTRYRSVKRW